MKTIHIPFLVLLSCAFLLTSGFAGEKKKAEAVRGADYLQLTLGNRWTFVDLDNQQFTIQITAKKAGNCFEVSTLAEGRRIPTFLWEKDSGFFTVTAFSGGESATLRMLSLPPEPGRKWTFDVLSPGGAKVEFECRSVHAGSVELPFGIYADCVRSEVRTTVGGKKKLIAWTFAPGIGIVRMQKFTGSKASMDAKLVRARIDGVTVKKPEIPKKPPVVRKKSDERAAMAAFKEAIKAFLDHNILKFYSSFSKAYREKHPQEEFLRTTWKNYDKMKAVLSELVVSSARIDPENPNRAYVRAFLADRPKTVDTTEMVKEDGVWKIVEW